MPEIPFDREVPDYRTIVPGTWSDILNAQLASFQGNAEWSQVRVDVINTDELASTTAIYAQAQESYLCAIAEQLRLLNARFEEAFQTKIKAEDVSI